MNLVDSLTEPSGSVTSGGVGAWTTPAPTSGAGAAGEQIALPGPGRPFHDANDPTPDHRRRQACHGVARVQVDDPLLAL